MEYLPKSKFESKTSKNNLTNRYFNNYNSEKIIQSPKITPNKLRNSLQEPKLYSLLDINDKITNSKGPKLSKQYKRLTDKELNKYYGNDKLIGWNYDKLFINKFLKSAKTPKTAVNSKNIIKLSTKETNNNKNNNTQLFQLDDNKITPNTISNNSKKNYLKRPNTGNQKTIGKIIPSTKRNDIWMPKNFKDYDLLVKNPKMMDKNSSQEELFKRVQSFSYNEIKKKMNDTDIFFTKNGNKTRSVNRRIKSSYIFSESDIFCRKNDRVNLSKSGETYLFKTYYGKKYTSSNESNSRWQPGVNYPNFMNYPSTNFNILSPNAKNSQYNKTKQIILEECKNYNKDKKDDGFQKKLSFFNPTHKQKGVGEFIDITKNGSGNPSRDFVNKYKENPLCFQRYSEVCATFGDVYYNYKNVSTRPFMKERFES